MTPRIAILFAVPFSCLNVLAGAETVVAVLAGDRFTVREAASERELRLYGADCPETGQTFFEEARAFVSAKILNKEVSVKVVAQDNGGLDVVEITTPEGKALHQEVIEAGLAWWDENNAPEDSALKKANAAAIAAQRGLWKDPNALAPWDYRKSHGLEEVKYTLASAKEETPVAPATEEEPKKEEPQKPKDLKLSGEGKYLQVPDMVSPILQQYAPQVDLKQVNAELARYGVRWATDANGATLGLTADVASIPGAAALGFQPGDIIASVNGMPVNSEAQLLAIAGSVMANRGGGTISGTIIRNGQPVDITLPIPKF